MFDPCLVIILYKKNMLCIMHGFMRPKINDRSRFDGSNYERIAIIVILCQIAFPF